MFTFKPGVPNQHGTYHVEMHDGETRPYLHCPLCGHTIPVIHPVDDNGVVQLPDYPVPATPEGAPARKPRKKLLRCEAGFCNFADEATLQDWRA